MRRTQKNPDDVVITLALRTPLCKAKKGGFKDTPLDGLLFRLLEQVVKKSNIDPQQFGDICLGNVRVIIPLMNYYLTASRFVMLDQSITSVLLP